MSEDEREVGYIKLHRSIESSDDFIGLRPDQCWIAVRIAQLANFKPAVQRMRSGRHHVGVTIGRGELAHSLETIAERTGSTPKIVRTTVNHLLRTGFLSARQIEESGTPSGMPLRILRVVNYDKFNPPVDVPGTPTGTPRAHHGHATGTPRALREEGEEEKEGEEVQPAPKLQWPLTERFRRAVSDQLGGQQNGGKGLAPLPELVQREQLEADLAKVGVDPAVAVSVEIARRNGRGRISALSYFLGIVHDLAVPPQARPNSNGARPTKLCPRCGKDRTGISEWASPDACSAGTCKPAGPGAKA